MKFTVQKAPLVDAVTHVSTAVSGQTTISILSGIKLTVTDTHISLIASDSDISIQVDIPSNHLSVTHGGSVVLPARFFVDIVRKLPGETVEIEVDEGYTATIRAAQSRFQLNGMDPDEFPQLPQLQDAHTFSLSSRLLKTMIRQTSFAVSTAESRPILTGVSWELKDGKLCFIATDSHRLARREAEVEMATEPLVNHAVIPGKSLTDLNKILKDDDHLVDIVLTDNQLLVKTDHILFFTRLLEGTYPDTSRIIPQSPKMTLVLKTKDLLNAIDRASLMTKGGKNNVVRLEAEEEKVMITADSPEVGKVSEIVDVHDIMGEPLKISFNAKFMLDALRALDCEQIRVEFTGAMAPFIIQPTDQDWILYLILPVRTYQ